MELRTQRDVVIIIIHLIHVSRLKFSANMFSIKSLLPLISYHIAEWGPGWWKEEGDGEIEAVGGEADKAIDSCRRLSDDEPTEAEERRI